MNTVLICWNNDDSVEYIKKQLINLHLDTNIELCLNYSTLEKKLDENKRQKEITGIIVLCELKWNHESDTINYSDMAGIELVKQYIRTKERIKLPILFVSFLKQKDIISQYADKKIISTPSLSHEFIDVLEPIEKWIEKIKGMTQMSKIDFEYSLKNFCDPDGMIRTIFHTIEGSSPPATKEHLRTLGCLIYYMNEEQKTAYQNINQMSITPENLNNIQDKIKNLCEKLSQTIKQNNKTEFDLTRKKINILYIEDELNTDYRIQSFQKEAQNANITFLSPDISAIKKAMDASKIDDFEIALSESSTSFRWYADFGIKSLSDIDVMICDIEIWDKPVEYIDRLLIAQGYSFIKKMISFGYSNIKYLILTNCTRDLYPPIISFIKEKNSNVFIDIDNKDLVLCAEPTRKYYINKIKHLVDKEVQESTITKSIFDNFYNYVHQNGNKQFSFLNKSYICNDIEKIIDEQLPLIINAWETNKETFNAAKKEEKKQIRNIIKGGLGFGSDFGKQQRKNEFDYEQNIGNFVSKLIFRRYIIYLIEKEKMTLKDACLTVSSDDRLHSNVLLFPSDNISSHYSQEEKNYVAV